MDNHKFGCFIAQCRKEKGWTQADLAEKIHVTDKAISKWERGAGFPDIKTLEPLAEALNISLTELMRAEKKQNDESTGTGEDDAISNTIDIAIYESEVMFRNTMIGIVLSALLIVIVFLIDSENGMGTFLFICVPILISLMGLATICAGRRRRKAGQKFLFAYIAGCIMVLFPIELYILSFVITVIVLP